MISNEPARRHPRAHRDDGERSRNAILDAAARLATTEGIGGLSLSRLTDAVGMSKSGAIDPAEDPAQITFEIEAALLLANAQYIVSRTAEPIERARRAVDRCLAAAGAPAPARDAGQPAPG